MKSISFALAIAGILGAGTAFAADSPIKARMELMKSNGKAMKTVSGMMKGETPYDAKAAAEAMKTINGSMDKFVTLFPKGSETGEDTEAKPDIWANMADFESLAKAAKDAAGKAETAAAGGMDSFKTAMGGVGKACKGCHEKYRAEKEH